MMKRPEVSEKNYNEVFQLTGYPSKVGLNFSLTKFLKQYKELQKKLNEESKK